MNIVLDLETIPTQDAMIREQIAKTITAPAQYKKADSIAQWEIENKPAAVEEAVLKTSFDGAAGHIVVAGIAFDNEDPIAIYSQDWQFSERETITRLFDLISERCRGPSQRKPRFIGHNLVGFDLRFLFQRAVMLQVRPPNVIPFTAKPWDDSIFDTMTAWSGMKDKVSLDKLATAMRVGSKGGIDGSQVWPMVQEGRIDEVAAYCCNDVAMTRAVYHRMTFAQAA